VRPWCWAPAPANMHLVISDAPVLGPCSSTLRQAGDPHGKQYRVVTKLATYDKQLAIMEYWKDAGGTVEVPAAPRARRSAFVRTSSCWMCSRSGSRRTSAARRSGFKLQARCGASLMRQRRHPPWVLPMKSAVGSRRPSGEPSATAPPRGDLPTRR